MKALGLIEFVGYVPAVVALDAALKAAEVSFQQISKIDKGIVSLSVVGDVAAVQASMDAAVAAAEPVGQVLYVHVIPRPDVEVDMMLTPPSAPTPESPSGKQEETQENEEKVEQTLKTEPQQQEYEPQGTEQKKNITQSETDEQAQPTTVTTDLEALKKTLTPELLEKMTVRELRSIARDMNLPNMTRKEIRFGKKEDLISSICKYLEQEC